MSFAQFAPDLARPSTAGLVHLLILRTLIAGRRYVSKKEAESNHMIPAGGHPPSPGAVSWGVDTIHTLQGPHGETPGQNRRSIKLTSKTTFDVGADKPYLSLLMTIDATHVPTGCATWPSFWMANENAWPKRGEVDMIEGTNLDTKVGTTLHTCGPRSAADPKHSRNCAGASKCTMQNVSTSDFTGSWSKGEAAPAAFNCDIADTPAQYVNQGCGIQGADGSYGEPFNTAQGGVFATEWSLRDLGDDAEGPLDVPHIATWFFPRSALPLPSDQWGPDGPDTSTVSTCDPLRVPVVTLMIPGIFP